MYTKEAQMVDSFAAIHSQYQEVKTYLLGSMELSPKEEDLKELREIEEYQIKLLQKQLFPLVDLKPGI